MEPASPVIRSHYPSRLAKTSFRPARGLRAPQERLRALPLCLRSGRLWGGAVRVRPGDPPLSTDVCWRWGFDGERRHGALRAGGGRGGFKGMKSKRRLKLETPTKPTKQGEGRGTLPSPSTRGRGPSGETALPRRDSTPPTSSLPAAQGTTGLENPQRGLQGETRRSVRTDSGSHPLPLGSSSALALQSNKKKTIYIYTYI